MAEKGIITRAAIEDLADGIGLDEISKQEKDIMEGATKKQEKPGQDR